MPVRTEEILKRRQEVERMSGEIFQAQVIRDFFDTITGPHSQYDTDIHVRDESCQTPH